MMNIIIFTREVSAIFLKGQGIGGGGRETTGFVEFNGLDGTMEDLLHFEPGIQMEIWFNNEPDLYLETL